MRFLAQGYVALILVAVFVFPGCSSNTQEVKKRLLGKWTDGTYTAEFEDGGHVWVEERLTGPGDFMSMKGQSLKYTAHSSGADLEGKGTATLRDDGKLHLKVAIETQDLQQPNNPSAKVRTNVDAVLEKKEAGKAQEREKALPTKADSKSIEPKPLDPTQPCPSVSVDPALSSWDTFLDIARKLYKDRAEGKHSERKDDEVVEFATEFRGKTVTWQAKYDGLEREKDGQSTQVKLDMSRPLTPPIVMTFRCAASDAEKWSDVTMGSNVRFSGKVVQVGTAWTKLKLPTGENRVQMMTVLIADVHPATDKKSK